MKQYQKILLAVDFSEISKTAAERVKDLAQRYDATLSLVHIVTYVPPAYIGVELPAHIASEDFLSERARDSLAEWADVQGLADYEQIIEIGQAKKAIVEVANRLGVDLVVLGVHDGSGFTNLFGSVAYAVAQHLECDVLVIR